MSLVEYRVEHSCSDGQGGPYRSSSSSFTCLLDSARLWRLGRSYLQPCWIRFVGSGSRYSEHDYGGNWSLLHLRFPGEESSWIRAGGAEGSEQARDDWNRVLRYLDDLYDDSIVYCSKSASFLASSFFSSVAGGVAVLAEDGILIEDRSVT